MDFKSKLRQICLKKRLQLSLQEQQIASEQICQQIYLLDAYQSAKSLALYDSISNEVNLTALWHNACQLNKCCYFPSLTKSKNLVFLPAERDTHWQTNRYGIREPKVAEDLAIPITELDLLFAPLLAFDSKGTRLGMGGGYYDRTLAHLRPELYIGIGYDFQYQIVLPAATWDISMDAVITPNFVYWTNTP